MDHTTTLSPSLHFMQNKVIHPSSMALNVTHTLIEIAKIFSQLNLSPWDPYQFSHLLYQNTNRYLILKMTTNHLICTSLSPFTRFSMVPSGTHFYSPCSFHLQDVFFVFLLYEVESLQFRLVLILGNSPGSASQVLVLKLQAWATTPTFYHATFWSSLLSI